MMLARIVVLLFVVGGWDISAQTITSTQQTLTDMLERAHTTVLDRLDDRPVRVTVGDHPDARWMETMFLSAAARSGHSIVTSDAPVEVSLVYNDVSTQYSAVESADSVRRILTVDLTATIQRDGRVDVVQIPAQRDTTLCLRQDALAAESRQHTSTRGTMPSAERTVWDDVLEPAIFVVAAAATIVLLFTVRSQ